MSKIPTHFPVTYKCGHTEKRDLSAIPVSRRKQAAASDFWSTKAGRDGDGLICGSCFNQTREKDKEDFLRQLMLDVESFEQERQLPELEGSPKQQESGLIDSARRDRYAVLSALLSPEESEHPEKKDEVLEAAAVLTRAGWWTDNLSYKDRNSLEYGQDEYLEFLLDGAEQQRRRSDDGERIETENPHDWDGYDG
ncbi:MAG TPA: hypothetical protein H9871_00360 [Candidatus Nesterenkonia stercoripullorum]|uniref:Uncharacterized protein n=1 Tax=Candidatus Nesterenkonia stercoripullorum TaxID=2838701 RepID=A0A9D1US70_9MICC|nr:hypothetical protein [Candidatus Nesterenkonia stercoripullorum]